MTSPRIRSRATTSGSSPKTSAGANSRPAATPRLSSARSTAKTCGARRRRNFRCRLTRFRHRSRAARRPSSTARSSIPKIRWPTSRASQSSGLRSAEDRPPEGAIPLRGSSSQLEQTEMNMPVLKTETAVSFPTTPAKVLAIAPRKTPFAVRALARTKAVAVNVVPPVVVLALGLLVWELLCRKAGATLPPPSKVLNDTWELIVDPFFDRGGLDKGLFWHMSASLQRVALGYALASIVGVLLGTLVGQSTWAMRGLDPIFQVLRTVPPLAWLPLSLAAFRNGQPSAIFVIFITAIWPIIINTAVGIRNIPQDYRNVAAVLRLNQAEFLWRIMLPAAAPYIFTGLRIGIGLSWLAIVAAEMLTGGVGIGFFIWDAWNSSRLSDIIVALFYIGFTGFALGRLVAALGQIVTRGTAAN